MVSWTIIVLLYLTKAALSGVAMHPFQKYCPSSIHCDVEDTVGGNETDTDVDGCCGSCSCDQNCGQTLSCCFEEGNDEYIRQHGKECVEPFIGDRQMVSDMDMRGVMMVTHCLDRNIQCKNTNGQINMEPVEGHKSEIFLNAECAECNNVNNFTRWDIKFMVTRKIFQLDFLRNLGVINSNNDVSTGTTVFLPISTSKHLTCEKHSFQSINYSSCPNETFKDLCASVILPYYSPTKTYKNVFCYMCHSWDILECVFNEHRSKIGSYSMLLDNRISTGAVSRYFSRKPVDSMACDENFVPHPYKVLLFDCSSLKHNKLAI